MSLTLIEWRRARGFSQQEMADKLQINLSTYRKWENDSGVISFRNGQKIAQIINVPIDDIIFLP